MSDETPPNLWERQPWDTPTSWAVFHAYLEQDDAPRSLRAAYKTATGKEAKKDIPGSIRRRLQGQLNDGTPIPGAVDYHTRIEAWDDYVADMERQKWIERRLQVREREWSAGSKLLERGEQMLLAPVYATQTEDGNTIIMPAGWQARDIPTVLVQASKLMRLSTGLSTENLSIDWREEARKEGYNPDELFNQIVGKFRAEIEASTVGRNDDPGGVESGAESNDGANI